MPTVTFFRFDQGAGELGMKDPHMLGSARYRVEGDPGEYSTWVKQIVGTEKITPETVEVLLHRGLKTVEFSKAVGAYVARCLDGAFKIQGNARVILSNNMFDLTMTFDVPADPDAGDSSTPAW